MRLHSNSSWKKKLSYSDFIIVQSHVPNITETGQQYSGTVKRHNVCKRHVSNDTGSKQIERAIFPMLFQWDKKIGTAFKCILEETMPKLSLNFGNRNSQNSHKNNIPALSWISVLRNHNTVKDVDQISRWSAVSLPLNQNEYAPFSKT